MPPSPEPAACREEAQFLAAIARGDREALRQLYAHWSRVLFPFALRLAGSRSDAEEILQDTFVKIWHHAASYDARLSRPFTWAVTILRRTAIDHLRKHRRTPPAVPLPGEDLATAEFSAPELARRTVDAHESAQQVRAALAHLASPQRDAVELALFSTLTQTEIAARLAQPVGTVKSWIRRGFLELRAALQATEPTP